MKITPFAAFFFALCGLCQLGHAWVLDPDCESSAEIPNLGSILRPAIQAAFAMARALGTEMALSDDQQPQPFKDLVGYMFGDQDAANTVVGGLSSLTPPPPLLCSIL